MQNNQCELYLPIQHCFCLAQGSMLGCISPPWYHSLALPCNIQILERIESFFRFVLPQNPWLSPSWTALTYWQARSDVLIKYLYYTGVKTGKKKMTPYGNIYCRPYRCCRLWQLMSVLAAHIVAPKHILSPGRFTLHILSSATIRAKMCRTYCRPIL